MTDSEAFVKARGGGNLIGKAMYGGGKITMKQLYLQSFEVVFDAYFKPGLVERFFTRKGQMGGNSQKICMIVEGTRAMMFVMLCHFGSGHTGIRLETLALIRDMLNAGISPIVPGHGSVGYLTLEGHIGMVMIGEGRATHQGETLDGAEALKRAGLKPVVLSSKEGLILLSGTTSVTAFASLAIYDAQTLSLTADIAGSFTLEVLKGTLMAMDERLMAVRPHPDQINTAANIRAILKDSPMLERYRGHRVQDALSIRCMPQLHGPVEKAYDSMHLAKYILAAELICDGQALDCYEDKRCAKGTQAIYDLLRSKVPEMDNDMPLTPYLEAVAQQIIDRAYIRAVEASIGELKF